MGVFSYCLIAAILYSVALARAVGGFDIPAGAKPSPLFGAKPFTQKMLLLEEMGSQPLIECRRCSSTLLQPNNIRSSSNGAALDAFLREPIHPFPAKQANIVLPNSWQNLIETFTGPLNFTAIEGRPPGEFYAHQRHRYAVGEFAPGSLYHNTTGRSWF